MASFVLASLSAVRPLVVGLTGGIGMGKSTASAWFRLCGVPVHDSDACVHALYAPGGAAVAPVLSAFPSAAALDGGIDRARLSDAVIAAGRDDALAHLERIVHPLVAEARQIFVSAATEQGEWMVVVDIPLLFETAEDEKTLRSMCDLALVVTAPPHVQRARCLARAGMSEAKLEAILAKQVSDSVRRSRADVLIDTGGAHTAARAQLAAFLDAAAETHAQQSFRRWCRVPMALLSTEAAEMTEGRVNDARVNDAGVNDGGVNDGGVPTPVEGGIAAGDGMTSWPPIRCVIFDLDETCFPTMPALNRASAALESKLAAAMPKATAAGATAAGAVRARVLDLAARDENLAHDLTELGRQALLDIGLEHGDLGSDLGSVSVGSSAEVAGSNLVDQIMDGFVSERSSVGEFTYADAISAIGALRAAGITVGKLSHARLLFCVTPHFVFRQTHAILIFPMYPRLLFTCTRRCRDRWQLRRAARREARAALSLCGQRGRCGGNQGEARAVFARGRARKLPTV